MKQTTEVLNHSHVPKKETTAPIWFYGDITEPKGVVVPEVLLEIQRQWGEKADAYGDIGTSVLGAGFMFSYCGLRYIMPPATRCQGSISWEHYRDEIQGMLEKAGATDITYNWGRMD